MCLNNKKTGVFTYMMEARLFLFSFIQPFIEIERKKERKKETVNPTISPMSTKFT
jgi:hypothetical protein